MRDIGTTRRGLILGAGKLAVGAAGIAALGAGGFGLLGSADAEATETTGVAAWPWPYEKLDPAETAEIAYNEWYRLFCGGAVISSVFGQLKDKVGGPYRTFPVDAFIFLEGGVSGWGTICGSNAGANIVSNLIIGPRLTGTDDGMLMGSEVMQWYSDAEMPIYMPKEPRVKEPLVKTVAGSPLCHVSVGKWMQAAGKDLKSAERRDRCARVTASVAYHLVELLNTMERRRVRDRGRGPVRDLRHHRAKQLHGLPRG